jgi:hypothetical protein
VGDDGLPDPPGALTTTWSKLSGPGDVGFDDANAVDTTASFSAAGTYVLRLTADDGALAVSDETTITVAPQNTAPTVDAGPDDAVELPGLASLDGTVGDDGLPDPPGALTTTWSKLSGPGDVGFDDANAVDTTASFGAAGTYVLRLTADDGALAVSDETTITVAPQNTAPTVDAGEDQVVGLSGGAVLGAAVGDDGLPVPPGALTLTWSQVSGPGDVSFGDSSAADTSVSFEDLGDYVLRLTADDGALTTEDDVSITVLPDTFTDLGGASQGVSGLAQLSVLGLLTDGSPLVLTLTNAAPSAPMYIWVSATSVPIDILGGTLHTNPMVLQVPQVTDAGGGYSNIATWPGGVPSGTDLYLQMLIKDTSAINSIALSNGVKGTVP